MFWTEGYIREMDGLIEILKVLVMHLVFIITALIFTTYLFLTIISAIFLRKYLRKNSYVDYNSIVSSPVAPTLSVIAPAFNESRTIIENVRTLLSLYYNNYEVIVVNDGSKDDSMEKLIEAYELEKVNYYFDYRLPCNRIRGVYKSQNRSFKKLTVIDKVNGGKADSLNAGLNVSKNDLVVSIDADSIMEPDALLKMVKPFLEAKDRKVIGTGGVVRIANSCEISGGHIRKIHLPRKFLPRAQVMEYTRAFLMGRMAWSELDGLLLISGALGMFDREVVIQAGGYRTDTVGEDMELVVRIRRYMVEQGMKYDVVYIPDPLCWTEVPSSLKVLARQRSRWTRGTLETLITHRKLLFNKKYGRLGLLGYPYWLMFEYLAPIIEFFGILWFLFLAVTGRLNWPFFLLLLGFVYFFAVSLSIWSVLFEEVTFHKYEKRRDVLKLIGTAFLEPFFYHPLVMLMSIKGNIDKLLKRNTWGKMERKGFNQG
jgi:cellulose synthase/poly-beta-1,6-N-acetylglucosamine synthase-like glycosyltransferase